MAHGSTKIIVPIGAVKTVTFIEIHHIGYIGEIVTWSGHIGIAIFYIDVELPYHGGSLPGASGNDDRPNHLVALVSISGLPGEIHINPPFA